MWGVTSMARGSNCRARSTELKEDEEGGGRVGGLGIVVNPEGNIATWCLLKSCACKNSIKHYSYVTQYYTQS